MSLNIQDEFETWRQSEMIAAAQKSDHFLTLETACEATQLSKAQIRKHVADGTLPAYFKKADIDKLKGAQHG